MRHDVPSCKGRKTPGQYLCRSCWFRLTPAARRALNRPDSGAYGRLRALYRQLEDGVPLGEIEVSP
ncbi:hypothetical protein [Streptomyces sp. UG1]|uniref:hypothetical protein n=1 Tax=Streptomyces sp. UG1 TaxID=3417652 RepID=UPI003CE9669D